MWKGKKERRASINCNTGEHLHAPTAHILWCALQSASSLAVASARCFAGLHCGRDWWRSFHHQVELIYNTVFLLGHQIVCSTLNYFLSLFCCSFYSLFYAVLTFYAIYLSVQTWNLSAKYEVEMCNTSLYKY